MIDRGWDLALGPLRSAKTGSQTFGTRLRDWYVRRQSGHRELNLTALIAAFRSGFADACARRFGWVAD